MYAQVFRRTFSTTPRSALARMQIIGRLTAAPELFSTSTGKEIVRYSVATNHGPAENRQVSYFRVASFAEGGSRDYLLNLPKGYVCRWWGGEGVEIERTITEEKRAWLTSMMVDLWFILMLRRACRNMRRRMARSALPSAWSIVCLPFNLPKPQ
jgi:hypothetical protein